MIVFHRTKTAPRVYPQMGFHRVLLYIGGRCDLQNRIHFFFKSFVNLRIRFAQDIERREIHFFMTVRRIVSLDTLACGGVNDFVK
jgi:hypothetical protein